MLTRQDLDEAELESLARALGRLLRPGHLVGLCGPMGAGKTTFTRALAVGLGVFHPHRVCSPTFNICLIHDGPIPLVHVDLFRLGEAAPGGIPSPEGRDGIPSPAFGALGLEDLLEHVDTANPVSPRGGAMVVEWVDLWVERPTEILEIELVRPPGALDRRNLHARAHGHRHAQLFAEWADATASGADTRSKDPFAAD